MMKATRQAVSSDGVEAVGRPQAVLELRRRARAHPGAVPRGARSEAEALGLARCRAVLRGIVEEEREELSRLRGRVAELEGLLEEERGRHEREVRRLQAQHAEEMEGVLREARRARYVRGTRVLGIEVA